MTDKTAFVVSSFMSRNAPRVSLDADVKAVQKLAAAERAEHLLVTDGPSVIGIVCVAELTRAGSGTAIDHVRARVVPVEAHTPVLAAEELMRRMKVGALPVVADGIFAGIVTLGSLVRARASSPNAAPRPKGARRRGRPVVGRCDCWPELSDLR